MKIALITDTHFGARNDSQIFTEHFMKFYDKIFFPFLYNASSIQLEITNANLL